MRTELSDGTITIRTYEPGIELAVFEAARESVGDVGPWMRTWREGATYAIAARHVAESIQAWRTGTWYDFAITRMGSAAFLGRVGLDRISASGTANVGYWVRTGQTGKGIATAAVRLIARFGFEDLGLQRLELLVAADNLASQRVAEKVGATFEGVLPDGAHGQGELEHTFVLFLVGSLRSFGKASWPVTQRNPGASDLDVGRQRPTYRSASSGTVSAAPSTSAL